MRNSFAFFAITLCALRLKIILSNIVMNYKLSFFILNVLILCSCRNNKPEILNFTGFTQGTTYSIVYANNKNINPEVLKTKVEKLLSEFDMSLSLYKDSSIISRLNRNEDVVPDTFFTEVFRKSALVSKMTNGAFDITVAPLVKAWGFGPDEHKNFSEAKLDSLLNLVGMGKVSIVNGRLIKKNPDITLDVNAIAQGYSVDVVCRFLEDLGFRNFLVEIGGEVRGIGKKEGAAWRIGIDKPVDNNMSPGEDLEAVIEITDKALATSGNYRKFYVEDGIKYSHTINPKTGYPARNRLLSATIIADDCAMADGIATACMVMGKEKSIEFINQNSQFLAYFIYSDDSGNNKTWISPGLALSISETVNE
jgi:thiamine biosynthesis lipoprotein